jgi:hypothetical protein
MLVAWGRATIGMGEKKESGEKWADMWVPQPRGSHVIKTTF